MKAERIDTRRATGNAMPEIEASCAIRPLSRI